MELFDYINDASYDKKDVLRDVPDREEKRYPAYLVNRYFSILPDTLFFANEMNMRSHVYNKLKHHFYLHGLRKKKRFTKWVKTDKNDNLEFIKQVYECSEQKAKEYLRILSEKDIETLKETYHHLITHKS